MAELREYVASEIEDYDDARLELSEDGQVSCTKLYIKSDADAVLAEKDKEIAKLEDRIAEGDRDFEWAYNQNERLLKIVRHQKRLRCEALIQVCVERNEKWICRFAYADTEYRQEVCYGFATHYKNRANALREILKKLKEVSDAQS